MFMMFVLLGLWITHCETPLLLHPPPPPQTTDITFPWSENGVQMPTLLSYQVIKCTYSLYPVTFTKLNNKKEKCHSQTSALRFHFRACKFLTILIIAS